MATEEAVPLANEVSAAFVEQYFHILGHLPHEARKFYADASVVSRPAPDGTMLSFTSVEAINKQILSCDYGESTTFEVLSVDSQNSFENGILVMVIGIFTGKDNLKKRFSQLFYLARQEKTYVVLNDIFRFIDDEVSPLLTLPAVESETEMAKPTNAVKKSVNAAEVKNVAAEATLPLDNGKNKPSDEKVVTAQKPKELVAETAAPQPLTFAAIVQSLAKNSAPFQVKAPVQKSKYTGQPRAAATPQAPATISNSEKKNVQKIIEEPGTSIFVANLPLNAMPPQLHELFKDFGPIKEDGIQVRSKAQEFCFGFVAFESAASVQNVLQAAKNHPFMLAGRKLRVKEKEVDYDGNKRSGGKPGGGSRIQNDSADGGDEFKRIRNRKNGGRNDRRGEKNNGGGAHNVKA